MQFYRTERYIFFNTYKHEYIFITASFPRKKEIPLLSYLIFYKMFIMFDLSPIFNISYYNIYISSYYFILKRDEYVYILNTNIHFAFLVNSSVLHDLISN